MVHKLFAAVLCAVWFAAVPARAVDLDAERNALGRTYQLSCQSYEKLDVEPLRGLYTDDAIESLYPPHGGVRVTLGARAIEASADRNFRRMRQSNARATLSYKITDREERDGVVIDRGFFRLQGAGPHGAMEEIGRVLVVQHKGADGRWRQHYHANAPATREDYDTAEAILTY